MRQHDCQKWSMCASYHCQSFYLSNAPSPHESARKFTKVKKKRNEILFDNNVLKSIFCFLLKKSKNVRSNRTAGQLSDMWTRAINLPIPSPIQSINIPLLPWFLEKNQLNKDVTLNWKNKINLYTHDSPFCCLCLANAVTSASGSLSDALVTALWSFFQSSWHW